MNVEKTAATLSERAWFKSSYSGGAGGECLEVAVSTRTVHVRDSKDTVRPGLAVGLGTWAMFVRYAVS